MALSESKPLLEGIRIADLSTVIFGPYCTQFLADMDADVMKIEHGIGDAARYADQSPGLNGMSAAYLSLNRNKRGVYWGSEV